MLWGDVTKIQADIYIVGHYQGVMPQNAEAALDAMVSANPDDRDRRVIATLTRMGILRGALGDVFFVPWKQSTVAIAGMGRPGTFQARQSRVLWRSVAQTIGRLAEPPDVCAVLIGSGAGTLSVPESVCGLAEGIGEAVASDTTLRVKSLKIVERSLDRAVETLQTLIELAAQPTAVVEAEPELREIAGGVIPDPFCYSVLSAAIGGAPDKAAVRESLRPFLDVIPDPLRERIADGLRDLSGAKVGSLDLRRLALTYRLRDGSETQPLTMASRVSFTVRQNAIQSSAITHTVTVPERTLGIKVSLIQQAVEQLVNPDDQQRELYGRALSRFLIHPDFAPTMDADGHLVLELDRDMARVPWEMLHRGPGTEPLSIRRPVARQLRTSYSPRPPEFPPRPEPRALVIGDPAEGAHALEDSRFEALEVAALLRHVGFTVTLLIGAPEDGTGAGVVPNERPADLFEVVYLLSNGEFDLVHFSGHADFSDEHADQTGWLFKGGMFLTPGDLESLERPPAIVVANACSSGVLARGRDASLVPGLADAFFRHGVYDYIGTAWQVENVPAVAFARAFYGALFGTRPGGGAVSTIGEAVLAARRALYQEKRFGNVWGAYQHYGDPTRQMPVRPQAR